MKKNRLVALATLTLLLGACAGLPQQKSGGIDALIKAAGIDNELASLEKPIPDSSVEAPNMMLPDDVIRAVNQAVASTIKPDAIRADIRSNLDKNMTAQQIAEALAFYQSPDGLQVVAVEAGQPGNNTADIDPHKLADLDTATGSSDIISNLAAQSVSPPLDYATANGCFGLDKNRFAGFLAGVVKKAVVNAVHEGVHERLSRNYKTLPPATIDAYLQFAQSATGQQFFNARNQAINNGLIAANAALSAALIEAVSQNCKAK
jgi:hypothetical protein